jgi:hypothetical protein
VPLCASTPLFAHDPLLSLPSHRIKTAVDDMEKDEITRKKGCKKTALALVTIMEEMLKKSEIDLKLVVRSQGRIYVYFPILSVWGIFCL